MAWSSVITVSNLTISGKSASSSLVACAVGGVTCLRSAREEIRNSPRLTAAIAAWKKASNFIHPTTEAAATQRKKCYGGKLSLQQEGCSQNASFPGSPSRQHCAATHRSNSGRPSRCSWIRWTGRRTSLIFSIAQRKWVSQSRPPIQHFFPWLSWPRSQQSWHKNSGHQKSIYKFNESKLPLEPTGPSKW